MTYPPYCQWFTFKLFGIRITCINGAFFLSLPSNCNTLITLTSNVLQMNQEQWTLKLFLLSLGIKVPNSVFRELLDTPVGTTLRGISDALDSLNIENSVYNLPKECLNELEYPYLMVLPHRKDTFVIVTNDSEKKEALPDWEGVVLTALKTDKTPIYKYVWLRNVADWFTSHQIHITCIILLVGFIINAFPDYMAVCHIMIYIIGLWISYMLFKKEYNNGYKGKYCKIGKFIDCEQVLESKGSHLLNIIKISDLSFLYFSIQIFLLLFHNDWQSYSYLLTLASCSFTLYSVVYQIGVIRKICLYCMSINLIVWLDTIIFIINRTTISIQNPFSLISSGCIAYMLWILVSRSLALTVQNTSLKNKASILYNRKLFDWFLSRERKIGNVDDKYADIGGDNDGDVMTIFVHPNCKNCKRVYQYIPELRKKVIVKIVSLASNDVGLLDYLKQNRINKTPTIIFNGRELPELYSIEDMTYII